MSDLQNTDKRFKEIPDGWITLDLTGCRYLGEIHQKLKQAFGLPEYYGENWDALYDCLSYRFDTRTYVEILGEGTLPEELRGELSKLREVFRDVRRETPEFSFQIF